MPTPIQAARQLRQTMTPEEKLLWKVLRAHRFKGYKFRRQHPIVYQVFDKRTSFYVADFFCGARKLVIELDGKYHEFPDQQEYDSARDKLMRESGLTVLRIKNEEFSNLEKVLDKIEQILSPAPLRERRGVTSVASRGEETVAQRKNTKKR